MRKDFASESEIYAEAETIARRHNIKIFKGSREPNEQYFKIFFFVQSQSLASSERRSQAQSQTNTQTNSQSNTQAHVHSQAHTGTLLHSSIRPHTISQPHSNSQPQARARNPAQANSNAKAGEKSTAEPKAQVGADKFNRPDGQALSRPESEYLIVRVFPRAKRVEIEDSNVKKSLEKRMGAEGELLNQGNVMTLETQLKSLVGHWLELSEADVDRIVSR